MNLLSLTQSLPLVHGVIKGRASAARKADAKEAAALQALQQLGVN